MSDLTELLRKRIDQRVKTQTLNTQLGIESLKRHSFLNKMSGNTMNNSSVLSGSVQDERLNNGRPTLIPFLYEGKVVDGAEAVKRALASKQVWPAFDTNEEATIVSKRISAGLGRKK